MTKSNNIIMSGGIVILLAAIAFMPRIMGLDHQIRPDELIWLIRSRDFVMALLHFDFSQSVISSHPGVTIMWLASTGMGIKEIIAPGESLFDYLFAARLPIAIAISIITLILFFLVKKIFNVTAAILFLIIVSFDPFLLGYSKIVHLDALLSFLMCAALLSFLVYKIDFNRKFLFLSGLFCAFAVLAKLPALFLIPFITLFNFYFIETSTPIKDKTKLNLKNYILFIMVIGITIFIFTPRMWVDPLMFIDILKRGPGIAAHEYGSFFRGESVTDPGLLFYPVVIFYRLPLITLIGFFCFVVFFIRQWIVSKTISHQDRFAIVLIVFVFSFVLFMSFPGKKMERYILPVFPFLSIIAGYGLSKIINNISLSFKNLLARNIITYIFYCLIGLMGLFYLVKLHPHPTTYFNPVVNAAKPAQQILPIAWGEGLKEAADYLNQKDNSAKIFVGCDYNYLLDNYFQGNVIALKYDLYEPGTLRYLDYLVITLDAIQKGTLRLDQEVLDYINNHQPEYEVVLNGIPYVYVYPVY
jgi:hypothetical protein